ncbi:MAG: creatininase family protein, partial [Alphaproteobacteria bacterium]
PALLLPTSRIGKSNEHIDYPGTLTFSAATLTALWFEIGESVARAGVRKLIFLNSHGGQPQVMEIVARELRVKLQMMAVTSSWWHLGTPETLFGTGEARHGIHAGAVETSMMLALAPDLVDMGKAQDFQPVMARIEGTYEHLSYIGGVGMGWQAQDIHPSGAAGNATLADPKKGRQIIDAAATGLAKLIQEVSAYPLDALKQR